LSIGRIVEESVLGNAANMSSSDFTIATASFMGSLLLISLLFVSGVFTADAIYSFVYEFKIHPLTNEVENSSASESNEPIELTSTKKEKNHTMVTINKLKATTISSLYRFFIQEDPMFFRSESLLFIGCLSILLLSYVFGMIGLGFFTSINTPLDTAKDSFRNALTMEVVRLILSVVYFVLYLLVFGDLSLLVYLFKYRRNVNNEIAEQDNRTELNEVLEDELSFKLFKKFAEKEFSFENVQCWNDLKIVYKKRESTSSEFKEILNSFNAKYLSDDSALQVNVPAMARNSLLRSVEKGELDEMMNALDVFKNDILYNLADTYARFMTTEVYTFCKLAKQEKEKLTEKVGMN